MLVTVFALLTATGVIPVSTESPSSDEFVQISCRKQQLLYATNLYSKFSTLSDTLSIENYTFTIPGSISEQKPGQTWSFFNGLVDGISSIITDYDFNKDNYSKGSASVRIQRIQLTGLYDIDGIIAFPLFCEHRVAGKGPLRVVVTGLNASVNFDAQKTPTTGYLFLSNLRLDLAFENISVFAQNFTFDGITIDWDLFNNSIRPLFDALWGQVKTTVEVGIQEDITKNFLAGCTLEDLLHVNGARNQDDYYGDGYDDNDGNAKKLDEYVYFT